MVWHVVKINQSIKSFLNRNINVIMDCCYNENQTGGVCGVIVTSVGNRHRNPGSNPGWVCLHFS